MMILIKFWRELTILLLAIFAYLQYSKEPRIVETTKIEYVDRVVEKVVTVEKEVVKDKKKRTTVQKPDGTKVVTETEENTKIAENKNENTITQEQTINQTETKIEINSSYNLGISVKLYPETEYAASLYIRLGNSPLMIGPIIYVRETKSIQIGLGIGIGIQI